MVNPLARRMIPAGVQTGAPNVLLLVPGRRSGIERAMPVTLLDFEGHEYVQATYGASGWGRNLRAANRVTVIHSGGRRSSVHPVAVPPEEAGAILQRALAPYHRSRLLRRLLGPRVRPPVGVLTRLELSLPDRLHRTAPSRAPSPSERNGVGSAGDWAKLTRSAAA